MSALTGDHKPSHLLQENLFFHSYGGRKSQAKMLAGLFLPEDAMKASPNFWDFLDALGVP